MNTRDPRPRPGIDIHQFYRLEMSQTDSAAFADIFAFTGSRGLCEPTKYTIEFSHPRDDLAAADYLVRMADFVIQPPPAESWVEPEAPRRVQGVITSFAKLTGSRDQTHYEITLESRLALLRNTPTVRFFFDTSEPEIIAQLLKEHGFDQLRADFRMQPYRRYRRHPIVTQWGEDDLTFITRLCRRTGIWFVCEAGEHCEVVRFGDDRSHYLYDAGRFTVPWRDPGGLHTGARESVHTLQMHANTTPSTHTVRSYSPERMTNEPVENARRIEQDSTGYGETVAWGLPYVNEDEAAEQATLRHEAALAAQITYEGTCDMLDLAPSCVLELSNRNLADAPGGLLVVRVTCSATRKQGYRATFTAIPEDRQYRHPLGEHAWPRIPNAITGEIAATDGYSGPYIDEHGRYLVHLHADRDARIPGQQSCRMRLAKPYAGPGRTGFHFALEPGAIVMVGFLWGNPDLPVITHALHTAKHDDPIVNEFPWRERHTIHTRANNTFQMEDRKGCEHIKTATEYGKSQLNLGYIVNSGNEARGEGFELRTDLHGGIRAGGGLLLSSDIRGRASGKVADTAELDAQFESTQMRLTALAESAQASKADVADLRSENQWLRDEVKSLAQSVLALSARDGIAMATPGRMMASTGKDISMTAGAQMNMNALQRLVMNAVERITLFAQKAGIGVISAFGPIQIQAQASTLQLAAQDDVTMSSEGGSVFVRAKDQITFECGGAFITIKDGRITLGAVDGVLIKGPFRKFDPAQMHLAGPDFSPRLVPFVANCRAWDGNPGRLPISHLPTAWDYKQAGIAPPAPANAGTRKAIQAPTTQTGSGTATTAATAKTQQADAGSPDSPNADHDSVHEPKNIIVKDASVPLKLEKAVSCDWHRPDFTHECSDTTETAQYRGLNRSLEPYPPIDKNNAPQTLSGGKFNTNFELSFDSQKKILLVTVRVKVIPVDIFECDPSGKIKTGPDGRPLSVPYECMSLNAVPSRGVDKPVGGHVMKFRDEVGDRFNVAKKKQQIDDVLNGHRSQLILNGCSKGAACGCRVKVIFNVELITSIRGEDFKNGKRSHKTIYLFPRAQRADAGSWGEINMYQPNARDQPEVWNDMPYDTNVLAHECGHLFNYPDEYWEYGGWVHEQYINEKQELDFAIMKANNGKETWQMSSAKNIMGGGCNNPAPQNDKWPPSATVHPYYIEYVRRHFCELTGEKPEYHGGDTSKPIWRRWRIGYEA